MKILANYFLPIEPYSLVFKLAHFWKGKGRGWKGNGKGRGMGRGFEEKTIRLCEFTGMFRKGYHP